MTASRPPERSLYLREETKLPQTKQPNPLKAHGALASMAFAKRLSSAKKLETVGVRDRILKRAKQDKLLSNRY
jgi:hypothetical protein